MIKRNAIFVLLIPVLLILISINIFDKRVETNTNNTDNSYSIKNSVGNIELSSEIPLVSEESTTQYRKITDIDMKVVPNNLGTITVLQINHISDTDTIYFIDTSKYRYENLAFKWNTPNAAISWDEIPNIADRSTLVPLIISEDNADEIDENFVISDLQVREISKSSIAFQINNPIDKLELHLYSSSQKSLAAITANHEHGLSYSTLPIISRVEWSQDPDINNPARYTWEPVYYPVNKVIIHHTAGSNTENPLDAMRNIYNFHAYSREWGDIGYNYLIDRDGAIYEGKSGGEESIGYHAGIDGNRGSIGIAMIGTYSNGIPSAAALNSLIKLIAEKAAFYNFDPVWQTSVFGHRDYMATTCPGNSLYNYMPTIASNSFTYKQQNFASIKSVVNEVENNMSKNQFENIYNINIYLNLPENINKNTILKFAPPYSGIKEMTATLNSLTLNIDKCGEFECSNQIAKDRLMTLYKLYLLNPSVEFISLSRGMDRDLN